MSAPVQWRAGRADGLAHLCPIGWTTALCGAQGRRVVERGVACRRCLHLGAERLAAEAEQAQHHES